MLSYLGRTPNSVSKKVERRFHRLATDDSRSLLFESGFAAQPHRLATGGGKAASKSKWIVWVSFYSFINPMPSASTSTSAIINFRWHRHRHQHQHQTSTSSASTSTINVSHRHQLSMSSTSTSNIIIKVININFDDIGLHHRSLFFENELLDL